MLSDFAFTYTPRYISHTILTRRDINVKKVLHIFVETILSCSVCTFIFLLWCHLLIVLRSYAFPQYYFLSCCQHFPDSLSAENSRQKSNTPCSCARNGHRVRHATTHALHLPFSRKISVVTSLCMIFATSISRCEKQLTLILALKHNENKNKMYK